MAAVALVVARATNQVSLQKAPRKRCFLLGAVFVYHVSMTIDEFQKAELKVGKVISAERVEGSSKLLKLQVDLGGADPEHPEVRQILSGIGKAYAPEDVLGKEVVIIANLDPREMMGMTSEGMILAAHGEGGEPVLLSPWKEVVPGSTIT
jgi:methionine--tRNA ligase beta chain